MLLIQKPSSRKYYKVSDMALNDFLQSMGQIPKYFWERCFYYEANDDLFNAISIYNVIIDGEDGGE